MEIRKYTQYNEDEIRRLYTAVGWTAYTGNMPALREGFRNSLLTLAAYEGEDLLGLIRTVGDGATIVFIQDILNRLAEGRTGPLFQCAPDRAGNRQQARNGGFLQIHGLFGNVGDRMLRVYEMPVTVPGRNAAGRYRALQLTLS